MRRLVWVLTILAVIWGGWWVLATFALEFGANRWLEDRRAFGWDARVDKIKVGGFPARFDMALEGIALADPATQVAIAAQNLRISARSYWPADATVFLPATPVQVSGPDGAFTLVTSTGQANLRLHPGTTLQLDYLTATSGPWQIDLPEGNLLQAQDFTAEVTQLDAVETYRFALNATQLIPGGMIRSALKLPLDWPLGFETFHADITTTFDAPLDRFAVESRRPQPREIWVKQVDAKWGALRLNLQGRLHVDERGMPSGQLDLIVENWRDALDLAEQSGAMPPNMRPQAEVMLSALANLGNDSTTLDLKLRFTDGGMFLGPIPMGPAPRIILR